MYLVIRNFSEVRRSINK